MWCTCLLQAATHTVCQLSGKSVSELCSQPSQIYISAVNHLQTGTYDRGSSSRLWTSENPHASWHFQRAMSVAIATGNKPVKCKYKCNTCTVHTLYSEVWICLCRYWNITTVHLPNQKHFVDAVFFWGQITLGFPKVFSLRKYHRRSFTTLLPATMSLICSPVKM